MRFINNRLAAYLEKLKQLPPDSQEKVYDLIDSMSTGDFWIQRFHDEIRKNPSRERIWKNDKNPLGSYFKLPEKAYKAKITDFSISTRLKMVLDRLGCITVADILSKTPWTFFRARNMGNTSLDELLRLIQSLQGQF